MAFNVEQKGFFSKDEVKTEKNVETNGFEAMLKNIIGQKLKRMEELLYEHENLNIEVSSLKTTLEIYKKGE